MFIIPPDEQSAARVSHNPAIAKSVILRHGQLPGLTGFARAQFPAGETAQAHSHSDMAEVFYVLSGYGVMRVNDNEFALTPGMTIAVEPGESHEIASADDAMLELLYFGLQT